MAIGHDKHVQRFLTTLPKVYCGLPFLLVIQAIRQCQHKFIFRQALPRA